MATSIKGSIKEGHFRYLRANTYHMVKMVKIGPVNPEIIVLESLIRKRKITN